MGFRGISMGIGSRALELSSGVLESTSPHHTSPHPQPSLLKIEGISFEVHAIGKSKQPTGGSAVPAIDFTCLVHTVLEGLSFEVHAIGKRKQPTGGRADHFPAVLEPAFS